MKHTIIKYLSFALILTTVFTSCRKDKFVNEDNELGDNGITNIKVLEGSEPTAFLESSPGIKLVTLFSLRKDAASSAALNETTVITLTYDPTLVSAYNTAHPTGTAPNTVPNTYETLPESIFTIGPGFVKTATGFTATFAPGDFARDFSINLNFGLFDFNKKYVLPFKITSNIGSKNVTQKSVLSFVSVKNAYDGKYTSVAGFIQRYTAPTVQEVGTLSGTMAGNPDVTLTTVNATTVIISGLNWTASGGGVGGVDPITMTIDPATNKVTQIKSGTATSMAIIAGATNEYNPTTKTFTLNFNWNQTANKREILGLVLKYKGSR